MECPATFLQWLKEYQTLAASVLALCAAGLAFYSAQRVAGIQVRAARASTKEKAELDKEEKREVEFREQQAYVVAFIEYLRHFSYIVEGDAKVLSTIQKILRGDAPRYIGQADERVDLLEQMIGRLHPNFPESDLTKAVWKEVATFDTQIQVVYQMTVSWTSSVRPIWDEIKLLQGAEFEGLANKKYDMPIEFMRSAGTATKGLIERLKPFAPNEYFKIPGNAGL